MSSERDSAPPIEAKAEEEPKLDRAHTLRMTLVILGLAAGFALIPRLTKGLMTSTPEVAPSFTLAISANPPEPEQTTFSLEAQKGHPIVLDFWATWCGPCQAQSPIVNGIAARFKDRGLVVVGVNTSEDDPRLGAAFAKKKQLSFPIVYDEGNQIAMRYHASSLPTLVVIDKEGKVKAVRHGLTSEADLDRLVRSVL